MQHFPIFLSLYICWICYLLVNVESSYQKETWFSILLKLVHKCMHCNQNMGSFRRNENNFVTSDFNKTLNQVFKFPSDMNFLKLEAKKKKSNQCRWTKIRKKNVAKIQHLDTFLLFLYSRYNKTLKSPSFVIRIIILD